MPESTLNNLDRLTDAALMLRFKDGDVKAFETLYKRYSAPASGVMRHLTFLLRDPHAAEDIFQDVWTNIVKASDRYSEDATFKTYFYKVMHNAAWSYLKKQGKKIEDMELDTQQDDSGDSFWERIPDPKGNSPLILTSLEECVTILQKAINSLPFPQRQCLLLQQDTNMTLNDIGNLLEVPRETIKSRLRYAVDKLRELMPSECLEA